MSDPKAKPLTAKDVHARLPVELLKKIKAEHPLAFFNSITTTAISRSPEDPVRAAVCLIQLSGRIPTEPELQHIRGTPAPAVSLPDELDEHREAAPSTAS